MHHSHLCIIGHTRQNSLHQNGWNIGAEDWTMPSYILHLLVWHMQLQVELIILFSTSPTTLTVPIDNSK